MNFRQNISVVVWCVTDFLSNNFVGGHFGCLWLAFYENHFLLVVVMYDLPFVKVISLLVCDIPLYQKTCVSCSDDMWLIFCQNNFVGVCGVRLTFGQKHFVVVSGVWLSLCQNILVVADVNEWAFVKKFSLVATHISTPPDHQQKYFNRSSLTHHLLTNNSENLFTEGQSHINLTIKMSFIVASLM